MGLRQTDLKDMVYDIIGIDEYSSKMGKNENVITISFNVKTVDPAEDLCDFLEKGHDFILDADVSPGETEHGDYVVFVEIPREHGAHENIMSILSDVQELSDIELFKFRYYKKFRSVDATLENVQKFVPDDPDHYGIVMSAAHNEDYSDFFKNSYAESVKMRGNQLTIYRKLSDNIVFEFIDYVDSTRINEVITEKFDIMESYPEMLYLTKAIGEYNIMKYGDKLVFQSGGNSLILKRI